MITRPTVLVLGAGASHELGLPLGPELLIQVTNNIAPQLQGTMRYPFPKILEDASCSRRHLKKFHQALSGTSLRAIDQLLAKRPAFNGVGRAAIAATLLEFEERTSLLTTPTRRRWCDLLFDHMTEGREDFEDNELSVITFNYDRTFEHFMFESLRNLYPGGVAGARRRLASIQIVHLHGRLGGYPPLTNGRGVPFGATLSKGIIKRARDGIKIVPDEDDNDGSMADDEDFDQAYDLLEETEQVIFLGFGFDAKNVRRLALAEFLPSDAKVYATTKGLRGADKQTAEEIMELDKRFYPYQKTCTDFMSAEGELFTLS